MMDITFIGGGNMATAIIGGLCRLPDTQIRVVVLRVGDEGQRVHERNGFVVIGEVVGLLDGDVGAVAAQAPAFELGEVCYNFSSCQRTPGLR